MGHRVVEAIIEDGQLTYVGERLPAGRLKVHLIYDSVEEPVAPNKGKDVVEKTAGIYKGIDAAVESRRLRRGWERHNWE